MEKLYKVQNRFLFHSNIKIKIPAEYDEKIFDILYGVLEEVNEKYNSYSKGSFINQINEKNGQFVNVDENTINILEKVIYYSDKLNGEYDITIMPLIKLWGFYKEKVDKIPSKEEIANILPLVNYKNIQIDKKNKKVKINEKQEIITGLFIKAYAIDEAIKKMKSLGIKDGVINAGGSSIITINENDDKLGIIIEGENKNGEEIDLFDIEISNLAYSTSNQINTYIKIDNKKYGHIISVKTGYPSKNKQIGIITETAFLGDIISTGLYNQTPEMFLKIIKELSKEIKIEGFLIDEYGKIYFSENFEKYIEN